MYMHVKRRLQAGAQSVMQLIIHGAPAYRLAAGRLVYRPPGPCLQQGLPFCGGPASTCLISPSHPPSPPATAAASNNGLAARITLQHCISTTARSTAFAMAVVVDAIYAR
ncbi:hypothetical protein SEVIR_9G534716v4 [Setaria viridis]